MLPPIPLSNYSFLSCYFSGPVFSFSRPRVNLQRTKMLTLYSALEKRNNPEEHRRKMKRKIKHLPFSRKLCIFGMGLLSNTENSRLKAVNNSHGKMQRNN